MKPLFASLSLILLSHSALANLGPQSFIYHGSIYQQGGTTPVTQSVDVIFTVLASNGCLLYEEKQTGINLSSTHGKISVPIGSPVGSAARTENDPALSMSEIFSNSKAIPASANCPSGYTGAPGDARKLHVQIAVGGGAMVTLSPDIPLASVPSSFSSDTIQGLKPAQLIQTSANITQATVEQLAAGTSNLYAKPTEVTAAVSSGTSAYAKSADVTNQISTAVSPLALKSDVTALQGQVSALPTTSVMNSAISSAVTSGTANLATSASVTALSNTVAALPTTAQMNSAISAGVASGTANLATSASVSTLGTAVSTNTADIASIKSTISGSSSAPPGSVMTYAGPTCPTGYLSADGSSYLISSYQNLANAFLKSGSSYVWGSADATHFNVPDMRGEFVRGVDAAGLRDPSVSTRTNTSGATVGGVVGSYEADQIQGHKHDISDPGHKHWSMSNLGGDYTGWGYAGNLTGGVSAVNGAGLGNGNNRTSPEVTNVLVQGVTSDGINGTPRSGNETRPKNVMMNFCVKY